MYTVRLTMLDASDQKVLDVIETLLNETGIVYIKSPGCKSIVLTYGIQNQLDPITVLFYFTHYYLFDALRRKYEGESKLGSADLHALLESLEWVEIEKIIIMLHLFFGFRLLGMPDFESFREHITVLYRIHVSA